MAVLDGFSTNQRAQIRTRHARASMHHTRTRTGPRHCKTNNRHSKLTLTANQINTKNSERITHLQQRAMNDNNNNRQKTDKFTHDNRLKYPWGADDEIMKIINRRDNSPETRVLGERSIEITKPEIMRYQWQKTGNRNFSPKKTR